MFGDDNLAWLGLELGTELAPPGAVFEALSHPRRLLNGRDVLPGLVVARTISTMRHIEDTKLRLPRRIQDLQHMRNAVIRFGNSPNAVPYLAAFGNEIVVGIDHKKRSDVSVVSDFCHDPSGLCELSRELPGHTRCGVF